MARVKLFNEGWKTKAYWKIINSAKERKCGDTLHHIIPKSLGGNNSKKNLVLLTHREHYVVHFLLVKMCIHKTHQYKMASAFWRMNNSRYKEKQKVSSRTYEIGRKLFSENQKGRKNYNKGGYTLTEKQKENLRGKRPHFNQTGENNNNFKGYYVTPWGTFASISEAHNKRKKEYEKMPLTSLLGFCKSFDVKAKTKTKYLVKGQKPEDLGFSFIPKEKLNG